MSQSVRTRPAFSDNRPSAEQQAHAPHFEIQSPSSSATKRSHPRQAGQRNLTSNETKTDETTNILVTVLMPCLNEARTLAACIQQAHAGCQAAMAKRLASPRPASGRGAGDEGFVGRTDCQQANTPQYSYEILIADNGSTDGSPEIAMENGARVVHVQQKGYGAALLGGIAAAHGKYIVMGDSDCSYDFGEVPRLLDKLEEGYDLVVGNRFAGGIMPGAMPWHHRYIGNPVLSGIGRLLYGTPCRDWHCGLRAFDRQRIIFLGLTSPGMEFASQIVTRAAQCQYRVAELPVKLWPDSRGRPPHLKCFRDGWRHLKLIFSGMAVRETRRKTRIDVSKTERFGRVSIYALVLVSTIVVSFFLCTALQSDPARRMAVLELPSSIRDGANVVVPIRFINTDSHTIEIQEVRASCGCMSIIHDNKPLVLPLAIPSQGVRDFSVTISPTGRSGEFTPSITFSWTTSAGQRQAETLPIRLYIEPPPQIEPTYVAFDLDSRYDGPLTRIIYVRNLQSPDSVHLQPSCAEVVGKPLEWDAESKTLSLEVRVENWMRGSSNEKLSITFKHNDEEGKIDLPVSIAVAASTKTFPTNLIINSTAVFPIRKQVTAFFPKGTKNIKHVSESSNIAFVFERQSVLVDGTIVIEGTATITAPSSSTQFLAIVGVDASNEPIIAQIPVGFF